MDFLIPALAVAVIYSFLSLRVIRQYERGVAFFLGRYWGTKGPGLIFLPAGFAGRNLPDVSLNADPETGYLLYSTVDGGLLAQYGGTSFVAPQLNGIAALLGQASGGRLGFFNPMLYRIQRQMGYGAGSPFIDITAGDNWFYAGARGYTPGAGLGVLNVANFAAAVNRERRGH